jgi:hypothetical protein
MTAGLSIPASLHLAGALDAMKIADDALGIALETMSGVEQEQQCFLDAYDLIGIQETVRLFLGIFAGAADNVRCPLGMYAARRCINKCEGLKRAALALEFSVCDFAEAIDAIDKSDDGNEWYGKCLAAHQTLTMMHTMIDSHRPRSADPEMN